MIDINSEALLPLKAAAHCLPAPVAGKKKHLSTVLRWVTKGVGGVKLEAVKLGGEWVTSREALQRFVERCTPNWDQQAALPRTSSAQRRASERAEAELEKQGV